jgi:NarL family two-component system response regulator LiaR
MHKYLVERNQIGKKAREEKPGIDNLTETERKVLSMVASNLSSKQIADELYVSKRTVQTHRYNICMKLNLKGNNALLLFALKNMHLFN